MQLSTLCVICCQAEQKERKRERKVIACKGIVKCVHIACVCVCASLPLSASVCLCVERNELCMPDGGRFGHESQVFAIWYRLLSHQIINNKWCWSVAKVDAVNKTLSAQPALYHSQKINGVAIGIHCATLLYVVQQLMCFVLLRVSVAISPSAFSVVTHTGNQWYALILMLLVCADAVDVDDTLWARLTE